MGQLWPIINRRIPRLLPSHSERLVRWTCARERSSNHTFPFPVQGNQALRRRSSPSSRQWGTLALTNKKTHQAHHNHLAPGRLQEMTQQKEEETKQLLATMELSYGTQGTTLILCVALVIAVTAAAPFVFGQTGSRASKSRGAPRNGPGTCGTRCLQHSCTGVVLFAIDRFRILTKMQSVIGLVFGLTFVRACNTVCLCCETSVTNTGNDVFQFRSTLRETSYRGCKNRS